MKNIQKINFDTLSIEVTRRCNMACPHCLRGDAQDIDLNEAKLRVFLSQVESINSIVFTGGEPTLNVSAINAVLDMCKQFDIQVYGFYVVTNGKSISDEFLSAMIRWYSYCLSCGGEPECCGVALSKDPFHDKIYDENEALLSALSFYRPDDKNFFRNNPTLIDLGRARNLTACRKREIAVPSLEPEICGSSIFVPDSVIAFTVNGDVLCDCDYEYESTDDFKICDYDNAAEALAQIAEMNSFGEKCAV